MNDNLSVNEFLEKTGSLEELQTRLSPETFSKEDERYLQSHILVIKTLTEMPKERIPETLLIALYSIEHSSLKKVSFFLLRDILYSLPYAITAAAGILFFNDNISTGLSMIVYAGVLSTAFGIFVYNFFKSKILSPVNKI